MVNKTTLPNLLCVARIALIIPLLAVWYYVSVLAAYPYLCAIFVVASLTDWLDGFLARKWQVQTPLGAMLDQIADKLLVTTMLIMLVDDEFISSIPAILLILREIWVSGLREYVGSQGKTLPVASLGKWKTALQMVALLSVLAAVAFHSIWPALYTEGFEFCYMFGRYLLWAAATISWLSAWQYSKVLFK